MNATGTPSVVALQWFDKVLLGVVALAALFMLGAALSADDALAADAERLADYARQLETLEKLQQPQPMPELLLSHQAECQVEADAVPICRALPDWSMHRRPYLLTAFTSVLEGPPAIHGAPTVLAPQIERGRVTLRWTPSPSDRYVDIKGYEVQRARSEAGPWMLVGEAQPDAPSFVDETVRARTSYWYRVISFAVTDTRHPRKPKPLAEEDRIKQSEPIGPVETPRDTFIVPQYVEVPDPVKQPGAKKRARVVVHVWDRGEGKLVRMSSFFIEVGEEIGDPKSGRGPMREGGVTARRTTGATLIDCGEESRKRTAPGGFTVSYSYRYIVVRHADGTEERFDNVDLPEELRGG